MLKKLLLASVITATSSISLASSENAHHFPGVFVGTTTLDSETEFSYGLEYEYKFDRTWGAGVVYEKTDDAHHGDGVDIYLASAYLHPWKELRLGAGFGTEKTKGHQSHKEGLVRVSTSYDFHLGKLGIAPTLAFDFVDGETATVAGIDFIFAF